MKKLLKNVVIYLVLLAAIVFAGGILFLAVSDDYDTQVVRSESMKPTLNMGDVVVTRTFDGEVERGDIISFRYYDELVTHRVAWLEGRNVQTWGDNMDEPDQFQVPMSSIEGEFVFRIPYLGFFASFIRTPTGWAVLVIVPIILLTSLIIRDLFRKKQPLTAGGESLMIPVSTTTALMVIPQRDEPDHPFWLVDPKN